VRDLAYDLAEHAAKIKYDDLPGTVVEITKKFILDTLGTTIAGSNGSGCKAVIEQVKEWGGKGESTVLVYGGKVIAMNAAMANGIMAHAVELDDTHDEVPCHANVSVLPAALAMAEQKGGVNGKDLITAVAVGNDVLSRISLGVAGPLTWLLTSAGGYFGATVAASKILGFDAHKLHHAMGIAFSQCAGSGQCTLDGALVKRMQPGFAARAGILSAVLADKGITGTVNIFEGADGFYPLYYPNRKYDRERILDGLGTTFEGVNLSAKLYPCCRETHAAIDGALTLVKENDIKPDDVAEVIVYSNAFTYKVVGKPYEMREHPEVDAQFSIPYTVAVAIVRRSVFINDFSEKRIKTDQQVLEMSRKVRVIADKVEPIYKRGKESTVVPIIINIIMKNGKVYSHTVKSLLGTPENPVSMEIIADKFRKCAEFSAKPFSKEKVEEIITIVNNLESMEETDELIRRLVA